MSEPKTLDSLAREQFAKRRRGSYASNDDEQGSILSRSPSPDTDDGVDGARATSVRGARIVTPPPSSLNTQLGQHNVGHAMLLRMGWKAGQGLGANSQGVVEPVPLSEKRGGDTLGLGKMRLDLEVADESTSQRKMLVSERIEGESDEQRVQREGEVQRKEAIRANVTEALRSYYCEICDKGYKVPSAYETHLTSYDHHHVKRLKELAAQERARIFGGAAGAERRREKERKRDAKQMQKLMGAVGASSAAIPGGGASGSATAASAAAAAEKAKALMEAERHAKSGAFPVDQSRTSGGGWAKVGSSASSSQDSSVGGWKKAVVGPADGGLSTAPASTGGWRKLGQSTPDTTMAPATTNPTASSPAPQDQGRTGGVNSPPASSARTMTFHSAGFSTLETSTGAEARTHAVDGSAPQTQGTGNAGSGFRRAGFALASAPTSSSSAINVATPSQPVASGWKTSFRPVAATLAAPRQSALPANAPRSSYATMQRAHELSPQPPPPPPGDHASAPPPPHDDGLPPPPPPDDAVPPPPPPDDGMPPPPPPEDDDDVPPPPPP